MIPSRVACAVCILLCAMLTACYGPPVIPVSEVSTRPPVPDARVVRRGDTLYNIAWEWDLDYRDLAGWNGLAPPYVIYPGQKIRLHPPKGDGAAPQKTAAAISAPVPDNTPTQKTTPALPVSEPGETLVIRDWVWPAAGRVAGEFSYDGANKGIDILGDAGTPVTAAADGQVVYAGSGLRGYGQLLIVKHNTEFLSAYAHQSQLFVREGETVKAGQKIGAMGSTGTDRTKLHFEIRRHGKPVNPLDYLPRRS